MICRKQIPPVGGGMGGRRNSVVFILHICLASAFDCENMFQQISYWIWKNYGFNFLSEEKENLLAYQKLEGNIECIRQDSSAKV